MSKYLFCVVAASFLAGCGGESGGLGASSVIKTELEGVWLKACGAVDSEDEGTLYSVVKKVFSENEVATRIESYEDSYCSIPASVPVVISSGTFTTGEAITTASGLGAKKINISYSKSSLPSIQEQSFDIYKIAGNVIHFGDFSKNNNGSSDNKRPVELNFGATYYLQ